MAKMNCYFSLLFNYVKLVEASVFSVRETDFPSFSNLVTLSVGGTNFIKNMSKETTFYFKMNGVAKLCALRV